MKYKPKRCFFISSSWKVRKRYRFIPEPKIRCLLTCCFRRSQIVPESRGFYKYWEFYLECVWLWRISGGYSQGTVWLTWGENQSCYFEECVQLVFDSFYPQRARSQTSRSVWLHSFFCMLRSGWLRAKLQRQATFPLPWTGTSSSSTCSHYDAGAGKGTPINDRLGRADFIFCTKSY